MTTKKGDGDSTMAFRDLYPNLADAQLGEAEENFARYLDLVLRIYERVRSEAKADDHSRALTKGQLRRYDDGLRSDPAAIPDVAPHP